MAQTQEAEKLPRMLSIMWMSLQASMAEVLSLFCGASRCFWHYRRGLLYQTRYFIQIASQKMFTALFDVIELLDALQ